MVPCLSRAGCKTSHQHQMYHDSHTSLHKVTSWRPTGLCPLMSFKAIAMFMLSRHWTRHLTPLVAFVRTHHNCLRPKTVCRAQQQAAVVAAHGNPCVTATGASVCLISFLSRIFPYTQTHQVQIQQKQGTVLRSSTKGRCSSHNSVFPLQVTTTRVQSNRKLVWPCLGDPVKGLEGCGDKVCGNLADTYAYAAELGVSVPDDVNIRRNVATGQLYSHAFTQICSQCVLCLQMCCVSKCPVSPSVMLAASNVLFSRNSHLLLHTLYSTSILLFC